MVLEAICQTLVFRFQIRCVISAIALWSRHKHISPMHLQIRALILLLLILALGAPAHPPQLLQLSDAMPQARRCRLCTCNRGRVFQSSTTSSNHDNPFARHKPISESLWIIFKGKGLQLLSLSRQPGKTSVKLKSSLRVNAMLPKA